MNKLDQIDAFREVLANYQLSADAKNELQSTKLVLLVGPTASGRNTIINELVKTGTYHFVISDTTRKPRVNNGILETNGVEYWFRAEDELLADLHAGRFLEAAIIHNQQVSGISIRELVAAKNKNKIAINEIEIKGAETIHALKPDAVFFFIVPPSFDEWMTRMANRGVVQPEELHRRLKSAANELEVALSQNYFIFLVNQNHHQTAQEINDFVQTGDVNETMQAEARQVAQKLLADTEEHLKKAN